MLSFLPGTYGTSLLRNHAMQGVLAEMGEKGVPTQVMDSVRDSLDCNIYFFGERVEISTMYLILGATIVFLIALYVLMNKLRKRA